MIRAREFEWKRESESAGKDGPATEDSANGWESGSHSDRKSKAYSSL